jgi:hypothetical protein
MQNRTINQESREVAAKVLAAMAATLPAENFASLQARGGSATWEEIVENALADYPG